MMPFLLQFSVNIDSGNLYIKWLHKRFFQNVWKLGEFTWPPTLSCREALGTGLMPASIQEKWAMKQPNRPTGRPLEILTKNAKILTFSRFFFFCWLRGCTILYYSIANFCGSRWVITDRQLSNVNWQLTNYDYTNRPLFPNRLLAVRRCISID